MVEQPFIGGLSFQVSWLGLRVAHKVKWMKSCNGCDHDNSTINVTIIIIRLHCSTAYVDAAYCYRPSSVVCRSVCLSVTLVSPAKMAAPIEIPMELRTPVGQGTKY